ncbi:hypothetical protein [Xanthomonas campestris]|uniref:hypothetical protein n=1 Tax=Xanthomonas campestris TaxID=339 RepID=UPI0012906B55|nr:hypothetical protein [Xanthomonas campestris]
MAEFQAQASGYYCWVCSFAASHLVTAVGQRLRDRLAIASPVFMSVILSVLSFNSLTATILANRFAIRDHQIVAFQNVKVISSDIWRDIRLSGNQPSMWIRRNTPDRYGPLLVLVATQPGLLDMYRRIGVSESGFMGSLQA